MGRKVVCCVPAGALLLLSACGGGGSGSPPPPPAPPANLAPTASASASRNPAYSSESVTLGGSGSRDPDGSIVSFSWAQTTGPDTPLTGANTSTATFNAPPVATRTTLTFRLTVTDNAGATSVAFANVSVDPAGVDYAIALRDAKTFGVDDEVALVHRSAATFQTQPVVPVSVTWASDIQGSLTGSSTDLTSLLQAGTHNITAAADFGPLGTVTRTLPVRVLPRRSPVPANQSTAPANATVVIPIVLINYTPTREGVAVDSAITGPSGTSEWTPGSITALQDWISTITTRAKFMLEEGSRYRGYANAASLPYVGYRVVDIFNYYEELPPGFPDPANAARTFPDYHAILGRVQAQNLVEQGGVREFWLAGYHFGNRSLNESNMASPTTGDISNSYRTPGDLPIFANTYIVYQTNYTRSHAEAVHNHGHQIEAMLSHINLLRDGNTNLFWRDFVGLNLSNNVFTPGHCGATHFPLNATADYDYLNSSSAVLSDCEDWRPDGSGTQRASTLSTWADIPYSWPSTGTISQRAESQWYIYWMQNFPGSGNVIPYQFTTMENWWEIIANWDVSVQSGKRLYR